MLPRSRKQSSITIQNKTATCAGIWKPSGEMISDQELHNKVICVTDKRLVKRYYIKNDETGKQDYIGEDKKWAYCVADPVKRKLIKCDIADAIATTDADYIKVANYITTLSLHGAVEKFIVNFIEDLLIYTNVTSDHILEILKGAFVLLEGDEGLFYNKYHSNKYMYATKKGGTSSHYSIIRQARMGRGNLISMEDHLKDNDFFELIMGTNIILDGEPWDPEIASKYHQLSKSKRELFLSQNRSHIHTWFQFEKARGSLPGDGNVISNLRKKPTMFNVGHVASSIEYFGTGKTANIGPFGQSKYTERNPLKIRLCKEIEKGKGFVRMRPCNLD
jgi:hypothetical protein